MSALKITKKLYKVQMQWKFRCTGDTGVHWRNWISKHVVAAGISAPLRGLKFCPSVSHWPSPDHLELAAVEVVVWLPGQVAVEAVGQCCIVIYDLVIVCLCIQFLSLPPPFDHSHACKRWITSGKGRDLFVVVVVVVLFLTSLLEYNCFTMVC